MKLSNDTFHQLVTIIMTKLHYKFVTINDEMLKAIREEDTKLLNTHPTLKALSKLIAESRQVDYDMLQLIERYQSIRKRVIEAVKDVEGKQYLFSELADTRRTIYDHKYISDYREMINEDLLKKRFNIVKFDKSSFYPKVRNKIKEISKEVDNTEVLVNRVLFDIEPLLPTIIYINNNTNEQTTELKQDR